MRHFAGSPLFHWLWGHFSLISIYLLHVSILAHSSMLISEAVHDSSGFQAWNGANKGTEEGRPAADFGTSRASFQEFLGRGQGRSQDPGPVPGAHCSGTHRKQLTLCWAYAHQPPHFHWDCSSPRESPAQLVSQQEPTKSKEGRKPHWLLDRRASRTFILDTPVPQDAR